MGDGVVEKWMEDGLEGIGFLIGIAAVACLLSESVGEHSFKSCGDLFLRHPTVYHGIPLCTPFLAVADVEGWYAE